MYQTQTQTQTGSTPSVLMMIPSGNQRTHVDTINDAKTELRKVNQQSSQVKYKPHADILPIGAENKARRAYAAVAAASNDTFLVVVFVLLLVAIGGVAAAAIFSGLSKSGIDKNNELIQKCIGKECKYTDPSSDWSLTRPGHYPDGRSHKICSPISRYTVGNSRLVCKFDSGGEVSGKPSIKDGHGYIVTWNGTLIHFWVPTCQVFWSINISTYTNVSGDISRTTPAINDDFGPSIYIGSGQGQYHGAYVLRIHRFTGQLIWWNQIETYWDAQLTKSLHVVEGFVLGGVSSNEESDAAFIPNYTCCNFRGSAFAIRAASGATQSQTYMIAPGVTSGAAVTGSNLVANFSNGQYNYWVTTGNLYDDRDINVTCMLSPPGGDPNNCFSNTTLSNSIVKIDAISGDIQCSFRAGFPDVWTVACIVPFINPENCLAHPGPDADLLQGVQSLRVIDPVTGELVDAIGAGSKGGVYWIVRESDCSFIRATQVGPGGVQGGLQWGSAADDKRIYAALSNWNHKNFTLINNSVACGGAWVSMDQASGNLLHMTVDPNSALDEECYDLQASIEAGNQTADFDHLSYLSHGLGPVTLINDVLFAGSMTGDMYAFAATTMMDILWSFNTTGSVNSAPAAWDRYFTFGSGYSRIGDGVGGSHEVWVWSV